MISTDVKARKALLRKAEDIFMDELPLAPLYYYTNVWTNERFKKY